MQSLGKILCENGMLDSEKEEIVFDFTDTNGDDWKKWENTYFTLKTVEAGIEEFIDPSGLYIVHP